MESDAKSVGRWIGEGCVHYDQDVYVINRELVGNGVSSPVEISPTETEEMTIKCVPLFSLC